MTAQSDRFPPALAPGHFDVDETPFEDLVAMSAGLAQRLRFFDLQDQPNGDWGEMFDSDEALVLARIASIDLERLQAAFMAQLDSAPPAQLARQVLMLAKRFDLWFKTLSAPPAEAPARVVCDRIEQLIRQQLGPDVQWLLQHYGAQLVPADALAGLQQRLHGLWASAPAISRATELGRSERELLRTRFFSFASALARIQVLARAQLPISLRSTRHEPAAGLLMAFLQLFGEAQQQINRFTARHIDFYYRDCLRLQARPALPDSVHLVCERDPRSAIDVILPAGMRFLAGKDAAGQPIEFRADEGLLLGDAKVTALYTLRMERDPLISPEREFGYVTRAKSKRLSPTVPTAADTPLTHWPLFGGASGLARSEDARVGLAIASPVLWLAEGEREIRVDLRFDHRLDSDAAAASLAAALQAAMSTDEGRISLPTRDELVLTRLTALFAYFVRRDDGIPGDASALAITALPRYQALPPHQRDAASGYDLFLIQQILAAPDEPTFSHHLGRFFGRWLLFERPWLFANDLDAIKQTAARLMPPRRHEGEPPPPPNEDDPLSLLRGPHRPQREMIFDRLFNGLFDIALSGPTGWLDAGQTYITRSPGDSTGLNGMRLVVRLRTEDPPVVGYRPALHGEQWPGTLPMLRMLLATRARLYPYTVLEDALLAEVDIAVKVEGLRDLQLHNNLGRLDPGKPFNPFGPLPTTASYLNFGSAETARKNLDALSLHIEWGGLPQGIGGFRSHYAGYGPAYHDGAFTVSLAILRDGLWQPATGSTRLFHSGSASGRLDSTTTIRIDPSSLRHHFRASDTNELDPNARNGWLRLQLAEPAGAFGHQAYPGLLTEGVTQNARRRRPLAALPNPPYTPLIERITLDYEASTRLRLGHESAASDNTEPERVLHLLPFGQREIHPAAADVRHTLRPEAEHEGNLFIGIAASALQGSFRLLFHLRDESAMRPRHRRVAIHWAYLANDRWWPLPPAAVLSDTTGHFLTSGIVTLDLPPGLTSDNHILPGGLYWLRVSADSDFETFAGLYAVHAQALRATRVFPATNADRAVMLPAGTIREPLVSLPGLAAVRQIGPSFGLREAEDPQQLSTRAGERLRHKMRATLAWDYERLVLDRFPDVFTIKCFPQLSSQNWRRGVRNPGCVLVAVVPRSPSVEELHNTQGPRMNAIELARITRFLRGRLSPFVRLEVRNAVYERIQVRCTVKLVRGAQVGLAVRKLNQAIVEFLSPWHAQGYTARFDWTVRAEDVEACIRALPEVDFVTKLSLLQVSQRDDGLYMMADTARMLLREPKAANDDTEAANDEAPSAAEAASDAHLHPGVPWSIAVPMPHHLISTVDAYADDRPEATGIAQMEVGGTFIVGGAHA